MRATPRSVRFGKSANFSEKETREFSLKNNSRPGRASPEVQFRPSMKNSRFREAPAFRSRRPPQKPAAAKKASAKKAAPQGRRAAKTANPKARASRKKTEKTNAVERTIPHEFSKKAVVIEMIERDGGATLDEIVKKTGWQRHTVRDLRSTLRSKSGLGIQRIDREDGSHASPVGRRVAK